MKLLNRIISIFLIGLYLYNQSVFSHLIIIDQHHETKISFQNHMHESGKIHEHKSKSVSPCNDSDCELLCNNIETMKLSCQSKTSFSNEGENYLEIHLPIEKIIYHNISNKDFSYYLIPTGPPIPIEELMPRVGPVVRII